MKAKLGKIIVQIVKVILFVFGLLYSIVQVVAYVFWDFLIMIYRDVLKFDEQYVVYSEQSEFGVDFLTRFLDSGLYTAIITFGALCALIGAFVLTKRRSVFSSVWVFAAFVIPREDLSSGAIRDKSNNSPVPFAIIRLVKRLPENRFEYIEQVVADADGKYSLYVPEILNDYKLEVEASGFSKGIFDIHTISKGTEGIAIVQDIALGRSKVQTGTSRFAYLKPRVFRTLMWILYLNSIFFLLVYIYYILVYPNSLYAAISIVLFGYSSIRNTFIIKERFFDKNGRILDQNTGKGIEGILVGLFTDWQKLESVRSGANGMIKFNQPKGKYELKIEDSNFTIENADEKGLIDVKVKKGGYLKSDIKLIQTGTAVTSQVQKNPFSD